MNILFLDIDGVLNSEKYYLSLTHEEMREIPLDQRCIAWLKHIIDETGALIVLTSSWRGGWDRDSSRLSTEGQILNRIFSEHGLSIYDKTPVLHTGRRPAEIRNWLENCGLKIHRFVIIDDYDFGWKKQKMARHWVRTDFNDVGLSERQAEEVIALFKKSSFYFFMERFSR